MCLVVVAKDFLLSTIRQNKHVLAATLRIYIGTQKAFHVRVQNKWRCFTTCDAKTMSMTFLFYCSEYIVM